MTKKEALESKTTRDLEILLRGVQDQLQNSEVIRLTCLQTEQIPVGTENAENFMPDDKAEKYVNALQDISDHRLTEEIIREILYERNQ